MFELPRELGASLERLEAAADALGPITPDVRDKVEAMGRAAVALRDASSADKRRQEWATPRALFDQLHAEYDFTVDAAANAHNAQLPRFWTEEQNGLRKRWEGERVWCNPPYRDILPWVRRALAAWRTDPASGSALLLPARTSAEWFRYTATAECDRHWFRGRIAFVPPPGVVASSNPEGSMLLVVGCLSRNEELFRCPVTGAELETMYLL